MRSLCIRAFQLQLETTYSLKAAAATVLNVTEDHMDRYVDLEDYRKAKITYLPQCGNSSSEFRRQTHFGEGENQAKKVVSFAENQADYWLKTENGKQYLMAKDEVILPCDEATLVGRHNYMNILAATALAQAVYINLEAIRTALRQFKGLDHRFQLAHQANGIRWINDSKATNVGSTVAALAGLYVEGTLHLLLGGDGKVQIFLSSLI